MKKKDNLCETDCSMFVISVSLLQFILGYVVFLLISSFCFVGMNLYSFFFLMVTVVTEYIFCVSFIII